MAETKKKINLFHHEISVFDVPIKSAVEYFSEFEPEFNRLVNEWKTSRSASSSPSVIAMHPSYQRIIGMGKPAIPLILRELNKQLDHWFWALAVISRENPVPYEHRGKMKQMAADWLQWGREKHYVR